MFVIVRVNIERCRDFRMTQKVCNSANIPRFCYKQSCTSMSQLMKRDFRPAEFFSSPFKPSRNIIWVIWASIIPSEDITVFILIWISIKCFIFFLSLENLKKAFFDWIKKTQCSSTRSGFNGVFDTDRLLSNDRVLYWDCALFENNRIIFIESFIVM